MKQCFVCSRPTAAAGFGFCPAHWNDWKHEVDKPWYKALKNSDNRERRHFDIDNAHLVSLEALEEIILLSEQRRA